MVVSLAFILLLRFIAGVLLWIIIFGVIAVIGYGIFHCYWEFSTLRSKPDAGITIYDIGFQTDFRVYLQLSQTWLIFMISLCVIEVIIILVLIFLRNRIRIAIALLKEGSKAIGFIMSTLLYPIITFLLLAICITYWAVTAIFLASSGNAVYKVMFTQSGCVYSNLTCDPETFDQSDVTKVCPGAQCTFAFWRGESVPPLHLHPAAVQPAGLPLAGQLHHRPGPVHPGRGLCLLLLGPEEASRHPAMAALLLLQQGHSVSHRLPGSRLLDSGCCSGYQDHSGIPTSQAQRF
ncbi:hypothetical protein AGOR_G00179240 [Albula goreensis]|uniref:Choline transporter-like protein n=1 Tax=Albula goreensis TaxID=1534307 RepID=A0A8T3D125_9TELE|nr:hypothetical protein AGOR_G00179240 [Albula goreensis]